MIVKEYDTLPIYEDVKKPRVGVVGEILVKYHPNANNNLVEIIEEEGGEAVYLALLISLNMACSISSLTSRTFLVLVKR